MACAAPFIIPDDLFDPIADDPNMQWIIDNLWSALTYDKFTHKGESMCITGGWCITPHPEITLFDRYPDKKLMRKHTNCRFDQPVLEVVLEVKYSIDKSDRLKKFIIDKDELYVSFVIADATGKEESVEILYVERDNEYVFELLKYCISRRAKLEFEFSVDY